MTDAEVLVALVSGEHVSQASRVLGGGGGSRRAADGAVQITELGTEAGLAAGEREAAAGGSTGMHFPDASTHADWEGVFATDAGPRNG